MPLEPPNKQQLNPFAFPPETHVRFRMLIVAALLLTWYIGAMLIVLTSDTFNWNDDLAWMQRAIAEIENASKDRSLLDLSDEEMLALAKKLLPLQIRAFRSGVPRLILPTGLTLLIALLAYLFYRLHPGRMRGKHAKPLEASEAPEIVNYIHQSANRVGVSPPPSIERQDGIEINGLAFGFRNRPMLLLYGMLGLLKNGWRDNREKLCTIVLHELGHLINRDAWRIHFSRAVWYAFLIPISGFILFWGFKLGRKGQSLLLIVQTLAMLAFVRAIWVGLLRIREFYADWRVASWGMGDAVKNVLSESAADEKRTVWWERLWKAHPPWEARRRTLDDPRRLFDISLDLPILTGLLLALVLIGTILLVMVCYFTIAQLNEILFWSLVNQEIEWLSPSNRPVFGLFFFFFRLMPQTLLTASIPIFVAYLVAETVGLQVQRETLADLVDNDHSSSSYLRLGKPALLFACGLEFGWLIAPMSVLRPQTPLAILLTPIWFAVFTFLVWLWLAHNRFIARYMLGTHAEKSYPKFKRFLVVSSSVLFFWVLLLPALVGRATIQMTGAAALASFFPDGLWEEIFTYGFLGTTVVLLILAFWFYLGGSLFLLIAFRSWLHIFPRRCPACHQVTKHKIVVGQTCKHCNHELAPWIYRDATQKSTIIN